MYRRYETRAQITEARQSAPNRMQRGWSRTETIILLVIVGAIIWFAAWPNRLVNRVNVGMTRTEAIAAIGRVPDKEEKDLSFCLKGATWHGNCDEVRQSKAVSFLVWKAGVDSWVVIGFNGGDKVSYRGQGDN